MKSDRHLKFLVFKLGGVAGAIRRLIYNWRGIFTASDLRGALLQKYPLLEPAQFQIHDTLDWMEQNNRIQCVFESIWGKIYKIAPYQLKFSFA